MNNKLIRHAMVDAGLRQWEAGARAGYSEIAFSRLLRNELPVEEQQRIADLIRGENIDSD